ncbi:MAG TPA: carbon-nitrogen hydrolase family protein [Terriglobia bacterium]|nr:carbon-nitrogen hydrolase family protein [Terriglobia bacterium]
MSNRVNRRDFLKGSAAGASALAAGLSGAAGMAAGASEADDGSKKTPADQIGRPVRVVSIGFHGGRPLEEIVQLVDGEGARGADLIAIPEGCRGLVKQAREPLDGPTVTAMSRLARKHDTYIVCPINRQDGDRYFNSAVLLDRAGKVACIYDKIFPVWQSECVPLGMEPGKQVKVFDADFGRVGFAICFDVNWAPLWKGLANHGAELVIWPSAYSAGRSLLAPALLYNYYIVSATWRPDCHVIDIDGEKLIHDEHNHDSNTNITRVTLDLDRCIFHQDLNYPDKLHKLLAEHGDEVEQEKWMPLEGWFVLKAKKPGVSARKLAADYGMEELRHYINRSQCEIDKCRGWEFA